MSNVNPFWHPCGTGERGGYEQCLKEYERFRKCLPQLIDDQEITGDLTGKWIIFKDGWVYGMAAYETEREAIMFGRLIFRNDPAEYIITQVSLEKHGVSALHLLGDALSELDFDA